MINEQQPSGPEHIYAALDFILARKWALLASLGLGLISGLLYFVSAPPPTTIPKETLFRIYPGGSPAFAAHEIADQVATTLAPVNALNLGVVDGRITISIESTTSDDNLTGAIERIKTLEQSIIQSASRSLTRLTAADGGNNFNVPTRIQYSVFLDGTEDGSIDLIQMKTQDAVDGVAPSRLRISFFICILGFAVGAFVTVLIDLIAGWRRYRRS